MDIRRKLSRAYSAADPDKDASLKKPVVKPVEWESFNASTAPRPKGENPQARPETNEPPKGLLKTGSDDDGTRKSAKFLLLIGKEEAAKIMRHFSEEELLRISRAMAEIKTVSKRESDALLREFGFLKVPPHSSQGGFDVAKSLLTEAFGPERAGKVLNKVLPFGGEKPFSFLEEYEAHQIASILKKESILAVSVVLSFLSPRKSSAVLISLPVSQRVEAVRRMGRMERLDGEALERMQTAIREKIRAQGKVVTEEVDGPSALAAILKHLSLDHEEELIQDLEEFNPELSREIKEKVYTLDLILNISDKELQEVLRTHPDEEIARMIKGRDMRVREKILHNVSSRRRMLIEEESDHLGRIPKREADQAARDFLDYLMKLADQDMIHFIDRDELI